MIEVDEERLTKGVALHVKKLSFAHSSDSEESLRALGADRL